MKKFLKVFLILVLVIGITGCNKPVKEKTDAEKFKEEYESLNGTESSSGKTIRTISISKDNPFVYATEDDIVKKIDNNETFIVYFGFSSCPWCRSILEEMERAAKDLNINKIYYVDVLDIRDVQEINNEGNIVTTKEGTEGYHALVERIGDVLSEYTLTSKDGETVNLGVKRIYAPNVVVVSSGKAIQMEEGISEELTDPYAELTDNMKKFTYNKFKCLFECFNDEQNTCQKNAC